MGNNEREELDRIIDGAISDYSAAEPLAGLEQRVLNRISVARRSRRRTVWFGLALAFATALVLVAIAPRTSPVSTPRVIAHVPSPPPEAPPTPTHPRRAVTHRHRHSPSALPKAPRFPLPAPLSGEERALLAFVRRDPADAWKTLTEMKQRSDEPIEIPTIQIKPLHSDGTP